MKDKPADIPNLPGCYLFKDSTGQVLYVGKAADLNKRIAQYFHSSGRSPRQEILVEKSERLEFIAVQNEVEALLLENNLIKNHQPRYNINLKDAKSFAYLEITAEDFPRLVISRVSKARPEGERFGPFVSAQERDRIRAALNRLFKLRTCRRFPPRPCVRFHIEACTGPCIKAISESDYQELISDIRLVLKGNVKELIAKLEQGMVQASQTQRFEVALSLRNRLNALKNLKTEQTVDKTQRVDEDALGYLQYHGRFHVLIFHLCRGRVISTERYSFDSTSDTWEEFLVQYYGSHPPPSELIVPEALDAVMMEFLTKCAQKRVKVTVPQRGRKHHLLAMIASNLDLSVRMQLRGLEDLRDRLQLKKIPMIIEGFDASHLHGEYTVASMVQFVNGQASKSNYRRFRIRTQTKGDDLLALSEAISRRYGRLQNEGKAMPDLILIDGGPTQLACADAVLRNLQLDIPLISLAKKEEQIFTLAAREPLLIPRSAAALKLLQQVRDEAHRFAHGYNRLLHHKGALHVV